jgi:putative ABC transport system substrate-binding protein
MLLSRHTRRREFITLLGAAAAWPLAARAQQPQRLRRVGLLIALPKDLEFQGLVKAFKQTLDAQGWVDGKNVHFDERWAEAGANRIPSFAADIVGATPDVILASSTPALVALPSADAHYPAGL